MEKPSTSHKFVISSGYSNGYSQYKSYLWGKNKTKPVVCKYQTHFHTLKCYTTYQSRSSNLIWTEHLHILKDDADICIGNILLFHRFICLIQPLCCDIPKSFKYCAGTYPHLSSSSVYFLFE